MHLPIEHKQMQLHNFLREDLLLYVEHQFVTFNSIIFLFVVVLFLNIANDILFPQSQGLAHNGLDLQLTQLSLLKQSHLYLSQLS